MFSFRSLFSREGRPAGRKTPRKPKARPNFRPRLECLEDRTLLNARFVVPVSAPVDNVSTFATLAAALDTAGLANGDTITIQAGSAPGQVGTADLQNVNARFTNLTIQGDSAFSSGNLPQFQVTDSSIFSANQTGFTLRNVNVALVGSGQLTFNTNATIANSTVVNLDSGLGVGTFPTPTGAIVFNGAADTLTNSTLVDDANNNVVFLALTPSGGTSNLISGNNFVENGDTNAAIDYLNGTGAVTDQILGNTIIGNSTAGNSGNNYLGEGIVVGAAISGLSIQNNTIADNGPAVNATYGIWVKAGATNVLIERNHIALLGPNAEGVRIESGTAGGSATSATLLFNQLATSEGTPGGVGLYITQLNGTATDTVAVTAQGNDFHNNQIGVQVFVGSNTSPSDLNVDLGGGGNSQGGNNFRNTPATGSLTGGAIVVGGNSPASATTIQAQKNTFGTGVTAASAVFVDHAVTNASINVGGNLTGSAAFVEAGYQTFLRRTGDVSNPADAGGFVGRPQGQVVNALIRSAESLGFVVDGLYQKLLGRSVDPSGRANFVNFLQHGGTVEQVIGQLASSAEYRNLFGSDTAFVQSLYRKLLGREGAPSEIESWVETIRSVGRNGVVNGILGSTEFRQDLVTVLYSGQQAATGLQYASVASLFPDLLHRASPPSAAEISGQVNSGADILTLEVGFASSPEFYNNG